MARRAKTEITFKTNHLVARAMSRRAEFELLEERCLFSTFTVTTTSDSGAGSLRQAILNANAATTPATINFKFSSFNGETIEPLTPLPSLTASHVSIIGSTVSTTSGGKILQLPQVELLGWKLNSGNGLSILGADDTVSTLQIFGFPNDGIYLAPKSNGDLIDSNVLSDNAYGLFLKDASNASIIGNMIGTDPLGTVSQSNTDSGIVLDDGASNNTIGGTTSSDRNVICNSNINPGNPSDTPDDEIDITNATTINNVIEGNYLGIDAAGTASLGEATYGLRISGSTGANFIGMPGHGNVICGAWTAEVELESCSGVVVQGNLIGTDYTGNSAIFTEDALINDFVQAGVDIASGAHNNMIGGKTSADRNIIESIDEGVWIKGGATYNTVAANYIGLNISGTVVFGQCCEIELDGSDNQIGLPGDGNVIAGFEYDPDLGGDINLQGNNNTMQGNLIGTNAAGTALPNGFLGSAVAIVLTGSNNLIGTTAVGGLHTDAANVISGNVTDILAEGGTSNTIAGNLIGTDVTGHHAIAAETSSHSLLATDGTDGIFISGGTGLMIGLPDDGNLISGNPTYGISLYKINGGVTIEGNYIGTDITGTKAIPNGSGIHLDLVKNVVIGSTAAGAVETGAANVISGNTQDGITAAYTGPLNPTGPSTNNIFAGNIIGLNAAGTGILANGRAGVELTAGSDNNWIGSPDDGNIISGNPIGILLNAADDNTVAGNFIGLDITGKKAMGNGIGIQLETKATGNKIGVAGTGGGNYMAASTKYGLLATATGTKNNPITYTIFGENLIGQALPNVIANTLYENGALP